MQTKQEPLILTLRLDAESQGFFDAQRKRYFPPERNFLNAHLTLFHQLPDEGTTREYLEQFDFSCFKISVIGFLNLGGGVAYRLESDTLSGLRKTLSAHFADVLIPQDRQGFRPHITIQNKVLPEQALELLGKLSPEFTPFEITAIGLDLWTYLGGPWRHEKFFEFTPQQH